MKRNKLIIIFILFIWFTIAICRDSYADSKLGFFIDGKTMAIEKFHDVSGKECNSPAKKAGLKIGDIIKEVNGVMVINFSDFDNVMKGILPDKIIPVKIERKGREKTYKVKTVKNFTPEVGFVLDSLAKGERISLAVIIAKVSNAIILPPNVNLDEWKKGIVSQLEYGFESTYVQCRDVYNNFSLVDRNKIRKILDELDFQTTDYVSNATRIRIGELTGATHLLIVEFNRFPRTYRDYMDIISKKLIDIRTGEVLTSISVNQHYSSGGRIQKVE
ncbi:MAG: site-2 protease family protein [Candidatus Omnitrophota bacterium]|nr:site-2 protease family protein [Candidatus Omnitrophota bacterium]